MVKEAGKTSITRLKSAKAAIKDGSNAMLNKAAKGTIQAERVVDEEIVIAKSMIPSRKRLVVTTTGEKVHMPAENTHAVENKLRGMYSKIGVNLDGGVTKGTGKPIKAINDLIEKAELDKDEGKSTIYRFRGTSGYEQALQDFEALNPTDVKPIIEKKTGEQIGYTGKINWNGEIYNANVRYKSSGKEPTIEIIISKYERVKFRYD